MLGLSLLVTMAWVLTLFCHHYARHLDTKDENSISIKMALIIVAQLAVMIVVFRYLSEWLLVAQFVVIGTLGFVLWQTFSREVVLFIKPLLKGIENENRWHRLVTIAAYVVFGVLILAKIFINNPVLNNIYVFAIALFAIQFGYMMSRRGCIAIFTAIAILDVFLVWMASSGSPGGEPRLSWYVKMFRSDFMQWFPFPLGFQWGKRMIGNGDIFFICFLTVFAKRFYGLKSAIWCGILTTAPMLLLPFAYYILKTPPLAWPYTIFIAPVALVLVIFFKPKNITPKVETTDA